MATFELVNVDKDIDAQFVHAVEYSNKLINIQQIVVIVELMQLLPFVRLEN